MSSVLPLDFSNVLDQSRFLYYPTTGIVTVQNEVQENIIIKKQEEKQDANQI